MGSSDHIHGSTRHQQPCLEYLETGHCQHTAWEGKTCEEEARRKWRLLLQLRELLLR